MKYDADILWIGFRECSTKSINGYSRYRSSNHGGFWGAFACHLSNLFEKIVGWVVLMFQGCVFCVCL